MKHFLIFLTLFSFSFYCTPGDNLSYLTLAARLDRIAKYYEAAKLSAAIDLIFNNNISIQTSYLSYTQKQRVFETLRKETLTNPPEGPNLVRLDTLIKDLERQLPGIEKFEGAA